MAERFDAKRLNLQRGSGLGSRMAASPSKLPDGWRFERRSAKSCVWFDDRGNRYRSSKEVEEALRQRELLSETETETETETEIETASILLEACLNNCFYGTWKDVGRVAVSLLAP